MDRTKETVERELKNLLNELLEYGNQEYSVKSLEYDEETMTCEVKMTVCIVEEDNYIGFQSY